MSSTCTQRTVLYIFNIIFIVAFYTTLISHFVRNNTTKWYRTDWITVTLSVFCGSLSIVYFGAALWNLLDDDNGEVRWYPFITGGVVWVNFTISLYVEGSQLIKILKSTWWLLSFLLYSALDINILVVQKTIQILEVVSWLLSFLLMLCGVRTFYFIMLGSRPESFLSESLLVKDFDRDREGLSQAGIFSKLFFSWISHLLQLGHSKPIGIADIPNLGSEDEASLAYQKFVLAWDELNGRAKAESKDNWVLRVIARVYWKELMLSGSYALLRVFSVVVSPLLLYSFVNFSNQETKDLSKGMSIVGYLVIVKVVESISYRHFYFHSKRIGMNMRSALIVAVYQKQLKLSSLGRRRHSTGEIVNYIAVDAYRMGEFPMWLHIGWTSGLQLFLAIFVLYSVVGIGCLPSLIPLLICGFLNVPFARILQKCRSELMVSQDMRLRSMSEVLNNMKIIKLQSWEEKFKNLIESYRDNEFKWLAESQYKKTYGTLLYWMSPTIVSSVVFLGCILLESAPLDASTIFTVLAALRSMSEPVRMIPEALSAVIQVKVSLDRIDTFLHEDELEQYQIQGELPMESTHFVEIKGGCFSWYPESHPSTLQNVNLVVRMGQKIAVCGPVGSGKSSILCAILGEIPKTSGTVEVSGSIAYVSQGAWIQSGTIRDNILFGKPMDKFKYDEAIKVSALDKDINSFDYGDLTEIGQRGLNLSGGQKQRVQLARAVYSDADIYLLDDPFSAVDAHTAATLFNDCVLAALDKKTVILVTHQVEFLSKVDSILVMQHGEITQSGSYHDLLMAGTPFEQLVNAHRDAITAFEPSSSSYEQKNSAGISDSIEESKKSFVDQDDTSMKPGGQLTEEEERETGNTVWKLFRDYVIISKGLNFLCWNIITQSGFLVFQAAASFWLAFAIQTPKFSSVFVISIYTLISTTSAIFVYLRSLFAALLGLRASKEFFSGLNDSIFNAPMLFFDSTPVGRILTRVSSDLSVIDCDIPFSYAYVVVAILEVISTIFIMALVTWQVLIVGTFAMLAARYFQGYYQPSARELMRINGISKAPVMNYAAETALGVAIIRSFNMVDRFFQNYLKLVDTDAKVSLYSNAAMEWLILRTEACQNLTLFTAAFLLVLLPQGYIAPGLVGLSLSYAFALTGTQVFMSRWYSSLANYIISVERIQQFMHIPPEPPAVIENRRPPCSWPTKGRIELLDLKVRYRPNAPIVLKGITCTFKEGSRVGVVGRTGSGKTTLISALFRMVEPYSGKLIIDDIDICSIGLKDLRLKLSIIPQEPTLFRGSVRTNLDPLGLHSDDEIWKVIEKCQLKDTISRLPNLLNSPVSDEGENWSMGQRQLFCLGRVLLKRNRILVLDEATASIDSATDSILQKIIREEFSDCTVITVAHRVPTVIDSHMVIVLSFGKLVEYDEPSNLMQRDSAFSKLVAEYWSSTGRS
ncbi:ATP-binding cassette [Lithospermum erythrorhizon]|uniref:ABC-type xenobiotic transporter n=1 Tax=Lithospermum erythrorhizon TaxID=34254 RepID=A0AAV3PVN3_LITER